MEVKMKKNITLTVLENRYGLKRIAINPDTITNIHETDKGTFVVVVIKQYTGMPEPIFLEHTYKVQESFDYLNDIINQGRSWD